MLKRKNVYGV